MCYERARQDSNLQPSDRQSDDNISQSTVKTTLSENNTSVLASCLAQIVQNHPDLSQVIVAWLDLSQETKSEIIAIIEKHSTEGKHNGKED